MKSILRHILTPFDKEFHRKMRICNLKTSNFSQFEKLEKKLEKMYVWYTRSKMKKLGRFFLSYPRGGS